MNTHLPRIAIDFSTHDRLHIGYGLYRYPVDLVLGLASVRPPAEFVLIGSRPEPVPELADVIRAGTGWSYVQFPRRRGRGGNFLDQFGFARLLRRLRVNLVHCLDLFFPWLPPTPVVVTIYDLMFEIFAPPGAKQSAYVRCAKRLLRSRVRSVIAISETTGRDLKALWHVPSAQIVTVPLGIAAARVGFMTPADPPIILTRYSLNPNKNLECLIRAFAIVRKTFPHVRLVMYGKDAGVDAEARLDALIAALGLEDAIERTGFISDEALDELYGRSTVFVLPSVYEGFGLPLVEAMSRCVCVVAHSEGATAEVVGDSGRLVDVRTPNGLADGILDVLANQDKRARWVQAGIDRAATFTRERMAKETYRVYEQCLECAVASDNRV